MNPKVTIVIPVYNGENYMREAIDCALAQTYENIEVIVVNDGSTDRSEEIALSYGDKIRYFAKENGGVSTALNVGIANMTGEYFQFLPHDDLLHPDKIKLQMEAIQKSGDAMTIAWCGWNALYEPEHKLVPYQIPPWYPERYWTRKSFPLYFSILVSVTVLINRKYFDAVGVFDDALYTSQDYDMWFRTFRARNTVYLDSALVDYRIHAAQGTQTDDQFTKNCQDLSLKMVQNTSKDEVEEIFSSQYRFFYEMMMFYRDAGWDELLSYAAEKFASLEEPENGAEARKRAADRLNENGRLILYGAGKNGKRLKNELWMYGLEASAFCDADPGKAGTEIDGIPCISKEELPQSGATVIITIDHPEPVWEELRSKGIEHITDYKTVAELLWTACPIKERVMQGVR